MSRAFALDGCVKKTTSPSWTIVQSGRLCGEPSARSVARCTTCPPPNSSATCASSCIGSPSAGFLESLDLGAERVRNRHGTALVESDADERRLGGRHQLVVVHAV